MNRRLCVKSALIIFSIISLAIVIWGFDKGFDMSDGGFNILRYQQDQPVGSSGFTYVHVLVRLIIPQSLRSIKPLRFIGFFLNLLGTLFFSLAIFSAYQKIHRHKMELGLLIMMMVGGFILSYAKSPVELSYNSLNQFFLIASSSFLILALYSENPFTFVFITMSGLAASFLYLIKVPSAIAMSIIGAIVIFFSGRQPWLKILVFWGSGILSLLVTNWLIEPGFISYYVSAISRSSLSKPSLSSATSGSGYGYWLLIRTLAKLVLMILKVGAYSFVIAISFVLYKKHRGVRRSISNFYGLLSVMLVIGAYGYYFVNHLKGGMVLSEFFLLTIFLIVVRWVVINTDAETGFKTCIHSLKPIMKHKAVLLLLFAAPFIGAYGTNNPLNWSAKFYYVCFMGLIALLYPFIRSRSSKIAVYILALYSTLIGLFLYVQHPYRYRKPLYEQTHEYKGIKYDPDTYDFLKNTEKYLREKGFSREQGLIVAYRTPGLAYLMGTYHPGGILWRESGQNSYFNNLKNHGLEYKPIIVSLVNPLSKDFINGLESATGLSLDMDYYPPQQYVWHGEVFAYMYCPFDAMMPQEAE